LHVVYGLAHQNSHPQGSESAGASLKTVPRGSLPSVRRRTLRIWRDRRPTCLRAPPPRRVIGDVFKWKFGTPEESYMYIGGILGTILIICLVVFLVRRI
jgi:hypothetical protein